MSDETNETSEQQPVDETTEGQVAPTAEEQTAEEPTPEAEVPAEEPAACRRGRGARRGAHARGRRACRCRRRGARRLRSPRRLLPPRAERAPAPVAKEEKKDVIPGADLEPIAVEPDGPALSAEERARLEAEEEEKARREAELAAAESESALADRAPAKMAKDSRFLATGKRKNAIARVILLPGDGKFTVNGRDLPEFFPRPLHQTMARQPLTVSGYEGNVDVRVRVHGGGISGQAGAVRHGIAKALTEIDAELRGDLKRRGFLTRDARVKERRKAGFKKARKKPQFSKR